MNTQNIISILKWLMHSYAKGKQGTSEPFAAEKPKRAREFQINQLKNQHWLLNRSHNKLVLTWSSKSGLAKLMERFLINNNTCTRAQTE